MLNLANSSLVCSVSQYLSWVSAGGVVAGAVVSIMRKNKGKKEKSEKNVNWALYNWVSAGRASLNATPSS